MTYGDGVGRTACAVHAYSLVGSDSCIGGGATLTARFAVQAVRAGVGASQGNQPAPRGTLGTSSCARSTRPPVVQGAAVDTRPLCAAACDLRGECVAFSHTAARAGGVCTLHGALHEGLVPHFNTLGEFTLDSHHHVTEQARPSHHLEYSEYPKYLAQPRAASCRLWSVSPAIAALCLQAIGENGDAVCMRKLVRRLARAARAAAMARVSRDGVRRLWRRQHRRDRRLDRRRHRRRHRPRNGTHG